MRLHYFFGDGQLGMENKDVTLFTGTGLKKEEIKIIATEMIVCKKPQRNSARDCPSSPKVECVVLFKSYNVIVAVITPTNIMIAKVTQFIILKLLRLFILLTPL